MCTMGSVYGVAGTRYPRSTLNAGLTPRLTPTQLAERGL